MFNTKRFVNIFWFICSCTKFALPSASSVGWNLSISATYYSTY